MSIERIDQVAKQEVTQDDIMQIALHDPIIYAVFAAQKNPLESWEQTLMRCVYLLHDENNRLKKLMQDFVNYHGLPNPSFKEERKD